MLLGGHTDLSGQDTSLLAAGHVFPVLAPASAERQRAHLPLVPAFSRSISQAACLPLLSQGCSALEARLFHYSPAVGLGAGQVTSL